MDQSNEFAEFINRIRAGDAAAAEELVRQYEPLVRREIRMRMVDSRLSRVHDSIDFSQAALASFFLRASEGDFELNEPQDLIRLLVSIARNKLASGARKQLSQKRDGGRREVDELVINEFPDQSETPSRAMEMIELIEEAKRRMSADEQRLAELRGLGKSWEEIAAEMGGTAQARRMQLARAYDRISTSLGMDIL